MIVLNYWRILICCRKSEISNTWRELKTGIETLSFQEGLSVWAVRVKSVITVYFIGLLVIEIVRLMSDSPVNSWVFFTGKRRPRVDKLHGLLHKRIFYWARLWPADLQRTNTKPAMGSKTNTVLLSVTTSLVVAYPVSVNRDIRLFQNPLWQLVEHILSNMFGIWTCATISFGNF